MPKLNAITLNPGVKHYAGQPSLFTDRYRYHTDDPVMQVVGSMDEGASQWSLVLISIAPPGANVTITSHVDLGPLGPGFELLVELSVIGEAAPAPFGRYQLAVEVAGTAVVSSTEFERVETVRNPQVPFPTAGIPVRVDAAPNDGPWPVSTGVPLPLGVVADVSELALFDAAGARVPAQFTPLADWYRPLGAHRSIKWVALDFVAQCRKGAVQEYRVRNGAAPEPAANWVADTDDFVTVDTGLIRFTINKNHGFNGIDKLERWTGSDWRVIAQYGVGPYLEVRAKGDSQRTAVHRIRFTAAEDSSVEVKVIKEEAAGSDRVTIRAEGCYYCASAGQEWEDPGGPVDSDEERKHCRFVIDVRAHRGTAQLDIASTLILAYDPGNCREDLATALPDEYFLSPQERGDRLGTPFIARLGQWWKQPIDIGWDWGLTSSFERGLLGYDTGDGPRVWQAEPWSYSRISLHQFAPDRCSIVTDAFDGLRHDVHRIAGGSRSEGWVCADLGDDAMTVVVRDVWQRFPKELSISRDDSQAHLCVHTWPRHGLGQDDWFHGTEITAHRSGNLSIIPDETDETMLRTRLWKLPFAHEGDAMDLRMPTAFVKRCIELNRDGVDRGWDQSYLAGSLARTAQGLATTCEMTVLVHDGSARIDTDAVVRQARQAAACAQAALGASSDPQWNGDTRVEGRFDAPSANHAAVEGGIRRAVDGWRDGLGGVEGCHGMWVHGSLHDNWLAEVGAGRDGVDRLAGMPQLNRVWQASHYRNVWMAWLLYFRSGYAGARQWALATSRLYADVGTVNEGPFNGRYAGDMAHCYGVTPWGTPYDPFGHWIDPDAHRMRYCLARDAQADRLYDLWWKSFLRTLDILAASGGWGGGLDRESANTFGALCDYCAFTHDAQAMVLVRAIGRRILSTLRIPGATTPPFYDLNRAAVPNADHPVWNRRWLDRYFELTDDVDAVRLAVDLVEQREGTPSVAAFAYQQTIANGPLSPTGEPIVSYLERHLAAMYDVAVRVVDTGGRSYHGHGDHATAASSLWIQEWPYFAHALRVAGMTTPGAAGNRFVPPGTVATKPTAPSYQRIAYPYRWLSGIYDATAVSPFQDWYHASVTLYAIADAAFDIHLELSGGTGTNEFAGPVAVLRYFALGWVEAIPRQRVQFGVGAPLVVHVPHAGPRGLYQILLLPDNPVPVKAPLTSLPEVCELRGARILRGSASPPTYQDRVGQQLMRHAARSFGRQLWHVAGAPDRREPMTLVLEAGNSASLGAIGWPCAVLVQSRKGITIAPRRVLPPRPPFGPYEYNGRLGPPATAGEKLPHTGGLYQLAKYIGDDGKAQAAFVVSAGTARRREIPRATIFASAAYGPVLRLEGDATRAFIGLDEGHVSEILEFIQDESVVFFNL